MFLQATENKCCIAFCSKQKLPLRNRTSINSKETLLQSEMPDDLASLNSEIEILTVQENFFQLLTVSRTVLIFCLFVFRDKMVAIIMNITQKRMDNVPQSITQNTNAPSTALQQGTWNDQESCLWVKILYLCSWSHSHYFKSVFELFRRESCNNN